jgi:hypothetical protein
MQDKNDGHRNRFRFGLTPLQKVGLREFDEHITRTLLPRPFGMMHHGLGIHVQQNSQILHRQTIGVRERLAPQLLQVHARQIG